MNCRGLPDKRRDERALQRKKTKRRENPRLTSYFPEEYIVCHAGNQSKEQIWKKHLISKKN